MKHGQGTFTFADGRQPWEGIWENNKFVRAHRVPDHIAGKTSTSEVHDELGSSLFVVAPKSKPLFERQGARYWQCDGLVQKDLLGTLRRILSKVSEREGMPGLAQDLCLYSVSSTVLAPGSAPIVTRSVDFFSTRSSMDACFGPKNFCDNTRTVTFGVYGGELYFSYWLIYIPSRSAVGEAKEVNICQKMGGEVVSWAKPCGLLPELRGKR